MDEQELKAGNETEGWEGNKGEEMDDGKVERDAGHDFGKWGQVAG